MGGVIQDVVGGTTLPVIRQVHVSREDLPVAYAELLTQNPLLGRIQGNCRTIKWTDLEIRTVQLLAACRSNASLTARLKELERALAKVDE